MSMIGVDYGVLNQKGSPSWFSDTYANIPTAGYKGRMFISIDTYAFYRDTGTGWDLIGGPGTGTITGSGTSGQVSYFNGTSTLAGSNNLFWDITNSRLGIGTITPGAALDIHSTGTNAQFNGTGSSNAYLIFQNAGTSKWRIGNTYNAGANSYDIYNFGTSTTGLSINFTTNAATFIGSVTATSLIKSGGTSAQILAADGSVITAGTNITISGGTISASGGGGSITLSAIGSTPNANAATLTGSALNLEPASASFGGVVTTGTQTFGGAKTFNSSITATSLAITGGTSAQFLKANGSVDSNIYLTTSNAATTYLALTGGSLTGNLEILNGNNFYLYNTGSTTYWWQRNNANTYELKYGASTTPLTILNTGEATFLSSVTATSFVKTSGTSAQILAADGSVITAGTNITISGGTIAASGGGGSITLSAIGSTPNANAATLTGSALNLEPASASFGGVVTTGTQTFGGAKTFNSNITATSLIKSGGTSAQILAADGSVITAGTNITISGGTIAASGGGSMAIGGSITSATAGSVLYAGASGVLAQSNSNFYYDYTNNRLALGTTTPGSKLQINGNASIGYNTSTAAPSNGLIVSGTVYFGLGQISAETSLFQIKSTDSTIAIQTTTTTGYAGTNLYDQSGVLAGSFAYGNASASVLPNTFFLGPRNATALLSFVRGSGATISATIDASGNFGLNTTTFGASKFQVNGSAAIGYSASTTASSNGLQVNGRGNFLNATDNALFSLNSGGTLYTPGFSPNASTVSSTTYTIITSYTTFIYNGSGVATWTLPNPSGTNQMFYIKNAGTGIITLNAYTGTNIIDNTGSSVSSITIAIGATAHIQQDGNIKSYQLQ